MSERYYITGVQIGILKSFIEQRFKYGDEMLREVKKLLEEIEDKQFVGKITQEGERVAIIG